MNIVSSIIGVLLGLIIIGILIWFHVIILRLLWTTKDKYTSRKDRIVVTVIGIICLTTEISLIMYHMIKVLN